MGFMDKVKSAGKSIGKQLNKVGKVNGHDFPVGSYINFGSDEGERAMIFTLPNNEEVKITHDMIESASVMAMGVIDIEKNSKGGTTVTYGTKYYVKLKDGRVAILTVGLGNTLYRVENVLF